MVSKAFKLRGGIFFIILIQVIVSVSNSTRAAKPLSLNEDKAIESLQKFNFQDADSLISIMEDNQPGNYITHLTRANYYWWLIITQEPDRELERLYLSSLDKAYQLIQSISDSELNYPDVFYFINIFALKARLDLINEEYLKAIKNLRKSIAYIERSLGNENKMLRFYLTSGLYNYISDYGAKKYPFFSIYTFLYPRGNMELGIFQLVKASNSEDKIISTEAQYFLMKIYLELEKDFKKADYYARLLTENYSQNLIYLYHLFEISNQLKDMKTASQIKKQYFEVLSSHKQLNNLQRKYLDELISKGVE